MQSVKKFEVFGIIMKTIRCVEFESEKNGKFLLNDKFESFRVSAKGVKSELLKKKFLECTIIGKSASGCYLLEF